MTSQRVQFTVPPLTSSTESVGGLSLKVITGGNASHRLASATWVIASSSSSSSIGLPPHPTASATVAATAAHSVTAATVAPPSGDEDEAMFDSVFDD